MLRPAATLATASTAIESNVTKSPIEASESTVNQLTLPAQFEIPTNARVQQAGGQGNGSGPTLGELPSVSSQPARVDRPAEQQQVAALDSRFSACRRVLHRLDPLMLECRRLYMYIPLAVLGISTKSLIGVQLEMRECARVSDARSRECVSGGLAAQRPRLAPAAPPATAQAARQ